MQSNQWIPLSMVAALATSLVACQSKTTEPEPTAPAPKMEAPKNAEPVMRMHDHAETPTSAPFVVKLSKAEGNANPGELLLTATIYVPREFKAPTTIDVELPPGGELLDGETHESFPTLPAGTMIRNYRVKVGQEPTEAIPVKVRVAGASPGGAFGASAERHYPERIVQSRHPYSGKVPPPPIARPMNGYPARMPKPVGIPSLPQGPGSSAALPKK